MGELIHYGWDFDAADSETRPVSVLPWGRVAKLAADDGDDNDRFGSAVAVDDDTAVVGAVSDEDPNGNGAGSAYVFRK